MGMDLLRVQCFWNDCIHRKLSRMRHRTVHVLRSPEANPLEDLWSPKQQSIPCAAVRQADDEPLSSTMFWAFSAIRDVTCNVLSFVVKLSDPFSIRCQPKLGIHDYSFLSVLASLFGFLVEPCNRQLDGEILEWCIFSHHTVSHPALSRHMPRRPCKILSRRYLSSHFASIKASLYDIMCTLCIRGANLGCGIEDSCILCNFAGYPISVGWETQHSRQDQVQIDCSWDRGKTFGIKAGQELCCTTNIDNL